MVDLQPTPTTHHESEPQPSPFSCNICHKTYSRLDHLARHVRAHTQEKPFSCPVCGKGFARADLLKRHSANHTDSPDGRKRRRLNQPHSRVAQACVTCAGSKLRCSGEEPCKRCSQKNLECHYNKTRTSIVQDDAAGHDLVESASTTPHNGWNPRSSHTRSVVVGPQYPDPIDPDHSHMGNDDSRTLSRLSLPHQPTQLPTPSGSGQPINVSGYPESMYDVGQQAHHYESTFARFLREVMMPVPINTDPANSTLGLNKPVHNFDLLNLAADGSLSLFPDSHHPYAVADVPDSQTDLPRHDIFEKVQSTDGHVTTSGAIGLHLGAQAFEESIWSYVPSRHQHVGANQNNMFLPLENLVAKTKCQGPPPCESLSPAIRDRILATILADSFSAVVPDVVSSFPSAELLTNLIHQFLVQHERSDDSWIHAATFNPNHQHAEFLMGVIAAGASMSDLPQLRNLGYAFQESARRSVTEQIERDNRTIRYLRPLQTYALHLDVGLWSGDRRRMELSESHAYIIVTMMRRGGFLRQSSTDCPVPEAGDSPAVTESKWKQWAERESFKRLAFHLLIRDAQTSISLLVPPMVSPSEILVELPMSSDLWRAKTSAEWKDLYLSKHSVTPGSIPTLRAAIDDFSLVSHFLHVIDVPLTNLLVLCSLWSLSWQYRELIRLNVSNPGGNSSLITKSLYQEIVQALQRFKLYSIDWTSDIQPLALVLHERVLLNLHASLEDVQLFAGKAGEDEARRIYPVLAAWAQSRESRQAVWYAGQIFRAAKTYPRHSLQGFSAVSLYHASLVFWSYSIVSNSAGSTSLMNQQDHQQVVFVDGEDSANVQRFIVLGKGHPALNTADDSTESRAVPVNDAKAIMGAITDLLKHNGGGGEEELNPLVSNLINLMRSLGNAAKDIMTSQSSTQSRS